MNALRYLAKLGNRESRLRLSELDQLVQRGRYVALHRESSEREPDRQQSLLRPVVKVALDPAALAVG